MIVLSNFFTFLDELNFCIYEDSKCIKASSFIMFLVATCAVLVNTAVFTCHGTARSSIKYILEWFPKLSLFDYNSRSSSVCHSSYNNTKKRGCLSINKNNINTNNSSRCRTNCTFLHIFKYPLRKDNLLFVHLEGQVSSCFISGHPRQFISPVPQCG